MKGPPLDKFLATPLKGTVVIFAWRVTFDFIKEIDTNDDENKENKIKDNKTNMKTNHLKQK